MKLAPLLAKFLYIHKRLDLPGIGSFLLDPSINIEPETNKHGKAINPEGISFENNTSISETPELIQFIANQTGKIKALAAADLDSHLSLAQQFMNIGKPFLFEGIGSLVRTQSREFAFTSGLIMPESMREYSAREISSTSSTEESFVDYRNFADRKSSVKWRKPVAILLVLAGLALAIWGGYTVYKRTMAKKNAAVKEETALVTDSSQLLQRDSAIETTHNIPSGSLKFILEVSNSKRAFERFGKLKTFQWNVQMETKDSITYTLYMLLPVAPADTSRVLDSLSMLYGQRVRIADR